MSVLTNLRRLVDLKLETWKGLLDYRGKDHRKFYPWTFAMNGQTARLETTRQIIVNLKIKRIIETGTYRGTTTEWFSQFRIPVETVEISDRYFVFSKVRLANRKNVTVFRGSSIEFLKTRMSGATSDPNDPVLFYLDAHWNDYLPLREELELIFACCRNPIVLIDDFKVPDDPGYGYDNYGPNKALTLEFVAASRIPQLSCFFPSIPSHEETGARRGYAVLTSSETVAVRLRGITLLREHFLWPASYEDPTS
jgi:hypothetical protein